jgi:2-polyprenyl-6-hydroxyphenyl methylase/3-demethylubiquinone-9 3-methyltransferase
MPHSINNQMYIEQADAWWDENSPLHLLKAMVNPWRVPYFEAALREQFGARLPGLRLLDIGCGGGVLAEEFAHLGCQVIGIDVAKASLEVASAHARRLGLRVTYQVASAARLPFEAGRFQVVSCCDVLEHIPEWEQVIAEVGRMLEAGGLFLFDTINRTPKSRVTFISGLQDWPFTRLFPANTHVWEMFITPAELTNALRQHGLEVAGLRGGVIPRRPLSTLREVRRYKRGLITAAELGRSLALALDGDLSLNYLGVARKAR